MTNNYNKIITTVNSVTEDYSFLPNQNECIVIDTSNNRIGINNLNPEYSLDISNGTIKAHNLIIEGSAVINNFDALRLDNKKFAHKHDTDTAIIIESSGNSIIFKEEVIFEKGLTFHTVIYNGASVSLDFVYSDVSFGGGQITNSFIGKTSNGIINRCHVGFFIDMDTSYLRANLIDVSNIHIYNNATIDNSLNVANIEISENLFVNNIADISALLVYNDISCNRNFYLLNDLNVYQNTYISGNTIIDGNTTISGNTNISGQLHIDNTSNLNGDVNINGNLEVSNGNVKIDEGYYFIGNGSKLTQVGAWALEQNFDASFKNVDICHNLTICNELIVYNTAIFKQDLSINGEINCDGAINIYENAYFSRNVDINELYVRGEVIFTENTDISINTINFHVIQIDVSNNLNSHNATINNKLDVSSLEISNNAIIKNTLYVNYIEISNNATINNKLDTSSIEISNNLLVNDSIFVDNNVTITNKLDASSIEISNNAIIHNNLTVNQDASFNNHVEISGLLIHNDLSVNNNIISNKIHTNYLTVETEASFNNIIAENVDICINLIADNTTLNTLTVNNKSNFQDDVSFNCNIYISNDITLDGNLKRNNLYYFKIKGGEENTAYTSSTNISKEFNSAIFQNNNHPDIVNDISNNNGYTVLQNGIYNINLKITWKIEISNNYYSDNVNNSILYIAIVNNSSISSGLIYSGDYPLNEYSPYVNEINNYYTYVTQSINEIMKLDQDDILSVYTKVENNTGNNRYFIDFNKSLWSLHLINSI